LFLPYRFKPRIGIKVNQEKTFVKKVTSNSEVLCQNGG